MNDTRAYESRSPALCLVQIQVQVQVVQVRVHSSQNGSQSPHPVSGKHTRKIVAIIICKKALHLWARGLGPVEGQDAAAATRTGKHLASDLGSQCRSARLHLKIGDSQVRGRPRAAQFWNMARTYCQLGR